MPNLEGHETIPPRKRSPHCRQPFGTCSTFTRRVGQRLAHRFTKRQALRNAHIELANEQSIGEGDALFFSETSRILAQLHAGGRTLARLDVLDVLPIALGNDGTAIVALEWDYAAWTQNAANFVAQLKAAKIGKAAPKGYMIALSGDASPMVQAKLKDAGVTLATRLAAGPLK